MATYLDRDLKRTVSFFYSFLLRPLNQDEDAARKEFILNTLLVALVALFFCLALVVLYSIFSLGDAHRGASLGQISLPLGVFAAMYFFSRLGYARIVAILFVWALFSLVTFALWQWGLGLPQAWLFSALVIAFSALLVSTRYSFFMTIAISTAFVLFVLLEDRGIIAHDESWKSRPFLISDAVGASVTFFVFTLTSWLSNREITRSLVRARTSEAMLKIERDSLEQKVQERTRELVRSQEARLAEVERFAEFGQLASGIMHDLANPLTAISLNLKLTDQGGTHIKEAVDAASRMEVLLKSARKQFVKTDSRMMFGVADEIEQVVTLLSYKARSSGVRIDTEAVEDVHTYGTPIKFFRVVMNLVSNAIEAYSGQRSSTNERSIFIRCTGEDGNMRLQIEDRGVGIPDGTIEHIFQPFYTTKTGSGSGLGLSVAKDIIEQDFGGTIRVESHKDVGTTFIVDMPIRSQ